MATPSENATSPESLRTAIGASWPLGDVRGLKSTIRDSFLRSSSPGGSGVAEPEHEDLRSGDVAARAGAGDVQLHAGEDRTERGVARELVRVQRKRSGVDAAPFHIGFLRARS